MDNTDLMDLTNFEQTYDHSCLENFPFINSESHINFQQANSSSIDNFIYPDELVKNFRHIINESIRLNITKEVKKGKVIAIPITYQRYTKWDALTEKQRKVIFNSWTETDDTIKQQIRSTFPKVDNISNSVTPVVQPVSNNITVHDKARIIHFVIPNFLLSLDKMSSS